MNQVRWLFIAAAVCASFVPLAKGASVSIPNASFETPNLTATPPYFVQPPFEAPGVSGEWRKQSGSSFVGIVVGGEYGVSPTGLDGFQFLNVNSATNSGIVQDTAPFDGSGNSDLYWQAGKTYTLTIGVFTRSDNPVPAGAVLDLRFYYRDFDFGPRNLLAITPVFATGISPTAITDYVLSLTVLEGSPAIGKPIGLWFTPSSTGGGAGVRDWGLDNVRLDVVPEPASGVLALLGAVCLLRRRRA